MSGSCCPADVKVVTRIVGTVVTTTYLDMRVSPPVLMDQAAYDALVKVKCPTSLPDKERVCLQPIGNTDAALIEEGWQVCVVNTTYSDEIGTVAVVTITDETLWLAGVDVTATHEVTACPEAITIDAGFCVAP